MKLISRNQVFDNHKNIAKLIRSFQKDFFDEEYDNLYDEMFDILQFEPGEIEYESFIIEINHIELQTYPKNLSEKLSKLLEHLNIKEMIIISHLKLDFYSGTKNIENEEILKRYKKLNEITLSKKYKEAFTFETSEIEKIIDIFFWINESNQCPEFIFYVDSNEKFCFYLCKYGKLHFIDFTNGNLITTENLRKLGFNLLKKKCSEGIMLE